MFLLAVTNSLPTSSLPVGGRPPPLHGHLPPLLPRLPEAGGAEGRGLLLRPAGHQTSLERDRRLQKPACFENRRAVVRRPKLEFPVGKWRKKPNFISGFAKSNEIIRGEPISLAGAATALAPQKIICALLRWGDNSRNEKTCFVEH
ncbi:hypothetical protein CEXT_185771 [Caerostris extrusa]|uniref:Uncharacterized protein n=1 Tax=Caerostris extrusa TaxID=172846 RepID=A0AAV4SZ15_CAEEX|nr:hypothetical protein CEXT_185771 [Caerostris extrusa]